MVSKQWMLAAGFAARKHNRARPRDQHIVSLETYRIARAATFDGSRINLAWPSVIDAILSKVEE